MLYNLMNGNSLELLKTLDDNSVDAIVTDPPYGLSQHSQGDIVNALTAWLAGEEYTHGKAGFMGKAWDSFVPSPMLFKECYRVLKHGGHILCFAGSRTQDLMSLSIRLAGFEMRDACLWLYGSGFPKGLDVAKGIDKQLGYSGKELNKKKGKGTVGGVTGSLNDKAGFRYKPHYTERELTAQAKQWEGWNTNLKPAYEPIIMARKPLDGTVVNNVLKHGVGGLNIDACRVGSEERHNPSNFNQPNKTACAYMTQGRETQGRYPANIILDGSDSVEALFPNETQRFFYHAKASKADRDEGVNGMNTHSTVKPTQLMRYLVKLVTPQGGLVLDPFMGSGSTGKACMLEGMRFIGMELSEEYVKIAEARIEHARQQMSLLNYEARS
jgi:site-specific DNA-methyltransferase (adenine-specific)